MYATPCSMCCTCACACACEDHSRDATFLPWLGHPSLPVLPARQPTPHRIQLQQSTVTVNLDFSHTYMISYKRMYVYTRKIIKIYPTIV